MSLAREAVKLAQSEGFAGDVGGEQESADGYGQQVGQKLLPKSPSTRYLPPSGDELRKKRVALAIESAVTGEKKKDPVEKAKEQAEKGKPGTRSFSRGQTFNLVGEAGDSNA